MERVNIAVQSVLFSPGLLGGREEGQERHDAAWRLTEEQFAGRGERDRLAMLSEASPQLRRQLCQGLLVGILHQPSQAPAFLSYVTLATTEGPQLLLDELLSIAETELWVALQEVCRQQATWLARELIKCRTNGADRLCWALLRNLQGGVLSSGNILLAEQLLALASERSGWLDQFPYLVSGYIFTYVRLLQDLTRPGQQDLMKAVAQFVVGLVRRRWQDAVVLGRDFVRLLILVARVPEVLQLWQVLLHHPDTLSQNFTGVDQLMTTPTPKKFLKLRITPTMERKLLFLAKKVQFGNHARYEEWFRRAHLGSDEAQTLRPDIIRYIVCCIHPTNEMLGSELVPRWALCGGLLTSSTSLVTSAAVKQALFLEWFFFQPDLDSVMCIEPAALLLQASKKIHPQVTAGLLDFLVRSVHNFSPSHSLTVIAAVTAAWRLARDRGVLRESLSKLLFSKTLSPGLRERLIETFEVLYMDENPSLVAEQVGCVLNTRSVTTESKGSQQAQFSDEEEPDGVQITVVGEVNANIKVNPETVANGQHDMNDVKTPKELKFMVETLTILRDTNQEDKTSRLIEELITQVINHKVRGPDCRSLASSLATTTTFTGAILPSCSPSQAELRRVLSRPLFALFSFLESPSVGEEGCGAAWELLTNLPQPELPACLLLHLLARPTSPAALQTTYAGWCRARWTGSELASCLVRDLTPIYNQVDLLLYLLPRLYQLLPRLTLGNTELLHLLVSVVDSSHVRHLVSMVVSQKLTLIQSGSCAATLEASLGWETFEQFVFWQLYSAHDVSMAPLLSFLPRVSNLDGEAFTHVMLILRKKKPTIDMLRKFLLREPDQLLNSLFSFWMKHAKVELEEVVKIFLGKHLTLMERKKIGGIGTKEEATGTLELLNHFNQLTETGSAILSCPTIAEGFLSLQKKCLSSTEEKFSKFFLQFSSAVSSSPVVSSEEDCSAEEEETETGDRIEASGPRKRVRLESGNVTQPPRQRRRAAGRKVSYKEDSSNSD